MMTCMPEQLSLPSLFLAGAEQGNGGWVGQEGGLQRLSAFFQV